ANPKSQAPNFKVSGVRFRVSGKETQNLKPETSSISNLQSKICNLPSVLYLLQQMTAKRSDLMTAQPHDPNRPEPCALCPAPLLNLQSKI
ncbi:MAG: hypothetical protein OEV22_07965, partial [Deltaproteobacteria bacterium]|nr:hypothetical protein [Deltaproteobacteria bacterium]